MSAVLAAIGIGMVAFYVVVLPLWARSKHNRLSPTMRRASDIASVEYFKETNSDSIINFDSAAGQMYMMRVEQKQKEP